MEKWFGRWGGLLASVLLSLSVVAAILVTCGCPKLERTVPKTDWDALTRTLYQQVESDDDDKLQEDDGDEDVDDV